MKVQTNSLASLIVGKSCSCELTTTYLLTYLFILQSYCHRHPQPLLPRLISVTEITAPSALSLTVYAVFTLEREFARSS